MPVPQSRKTLLLVGASRGLGFAMAEEFLERGWNVVGTVRGEARTRLHELAGKSAGRIEIETLHRASPACDTSITSVEWFLGRAQRQVFDATDHSCTLR
jgi:NAD(P)-dependent dehydrogenase (short-subunit alcohol dehydrogenase family)